MRFPTALGGFLAICGAVILILRPVVNVGGPERPLESVEATGPVIVYRQIPAWVGVASILSGVTLLGVSFLTANRR